MRIGSFTSTMRPYAPGCSGCPQGSSRGQPYAARFRFAWSGLARARGSAAERAGGAFAVLPASAGQGTGGRIVAAAVEQLSEDFRSVHLSSPTRTALIARFAAGNRRLAKAYGFPAGAVAISPLPPSASAPMESIFSLTTQALLDDGAGLHANPSGFGSSVLASNEGSKGHLFQTAWRLSLPSRRSPSLSRFLAERFPAEAASWLPKSAEDFPVWTDRHSLLWLAMILRLTQIPVVREDPRTISPRILRVWQKEGE